MAENSTVEEISITDDEPLVWIILVHYNSLEDTLRCLKSLEKLRYRNYFVVVVDNCSPNGSGMVLRQSCAGKSRVKIILNPENQGFAAGNNVGMAYARAMGAQYLWLLNADTEVKEDALLALLAAAERNPNAAAFGSKIYYAPALPGEEKDRRETPVIWGFGGRIDFEKNQLWMIGNGESESAQFKEETEVDYLPGCSLFVSGRFVDLVGYMPECYFMYFEETDWCVRMKRLGARLICVPESVVWHHFSDEKLQEAFTVYYYNRNERLFWFSQTDWQNRARIIAKTLTCDLPRITWALARAPEEASRIVFYAHLRAAIDFLFRRIGKRW